MTTIDSNALLQLQVDCGIPYTPTPLTYELRLAVSGKGPRAYDWSDKPHCLLYDACSEIERLTADRDALIAKMSAAQEYIDELRDLVYQIHNDWIHND
jgi:hypothetical protein